MGRGSGNEVELGVPARHGGPDDVQRSWRDERGVCWQETRTARHGDDGSFAIAPDFGLDSFEANWALSELVGTFEDKHPWNLAETVEARREALEAQLQAAEASWPGAASAAARARAISMLYLDESEANRVRVNVSCGLPLAAGGRCTFSGLADTDRTAYEHGAAVLFCPGCGGRIVQHSYHSSFAPVGE